MKQIKRCFLHDGATLFLPVGSTILSVQRQDSMPVAWIEVDLNNPDVHGYRVVAYHQGYSEVPIADHLCYVGSLLDEPYSCVHYYLDRRR